MTLPTRLEFRRSRFYLACAKYNKHNEECLKHIRELLERADQSNKKRATVRKKTRIGTSWRLPDSDDGACKRRDTAEHVAILSAEKDKTGWDYDDENEEYSLTYGDYTVMKVPKEIFERLKPFQRDAVKWVGGLPCGGILADDMGMGKTFMSIAALGARMLVGRVQMVLIVVPVSMLGSWTEECNKWLTKYVRTARVLKIHGGKQKDRQKAVRNAWRDNGRPYILISSWGLVASARTMTTFMPPVKKNWDYVILDEAHECKNHTSNRFKCIKKISRRPGTNRLLLTGTPFQNDTSELWSIVDLATSGEVLGKKKEFDKEFGKPIRDARCRSASSNDLKEGEKANNRLQNKLKPYLLRRRKMDFLSKELPTKYETCVWINPSKQQTLMYKEKLQSNESLAKSMLSSDKDIANKARLTAFQLIHELKKLCAHPLLLLKGGAEGDIRSALEQHSLDIILNGSEKLKLVVHMLKAFSADDKKTILFSQSTQTLDIIQHVLVKLGCFKIARLDGSTPEKRRPVMVKLFQEGHFDVLLLSTGAGGVGLTLTRASRVIVYDPSWNPSQDAQAVDRAYRIGQDQEVRVYRLFVSGSLEENMYEKQVHKAGLESTIFTQGTKPETRYFDKHELCKVFARIPEAGKPCELLRRFKTEGVGQVGLDQAHCHVIVKAHASVIGISDHTTVYRQQRKNVFSNTHDTVEQAAKRPKMMGCDSCSSLE